MTVKRSERNLVEVQKTIDYWEKDVQDQGEDFASGKPSVLI